MALFTTNIPRSYIRRHMKPKHADGPWGEAIVYWLNERGWQQADLVRKGQGTLTKNTVSTAFRGLDVNTMTLRLIAAVFEVPIEDVLVSPERKADSEIRKQEIQEITESVYSRMTATPPAQPAADKKPSPVMLEKLARKAMRRVRVIPNRHKKAAKKRHRP